jgi:hypothetical protein
MNRLSARTDDDSDKYNENVVLELNNLIVP